MKRTSTASNANKNNKIFKTIVLLFYTHGKHINQFRTSAFKMWEKTFDFIIFYKIIMETPSPILCWPN